MGHGVIVLLALALSGCTHGGNGLDADGDDSFVVDPSSEDTFLFDQTEDVVIVEVEDGAPEEAEETPDTADVVDALDVPAEDVGGDELIVEPDLPVIHNHSGSSASHATALVRSALDGLGFPDGSSEGPRPEDKVFVGRWLMVWIDQTGFYGKMNGLWRLDGEPGDDLGFVLLDGGRPVNTFIVGEFGDGRWPPGYRGSEHVEFPSRTPEANDDPACASRDWCNQYGLNEAGAVTDPDIPWWSACNAGSPAWTDVFDPVSEEAIEGGIRLVYEGPFVKQADGDGTWDGDACHEDWLFPDGVRRRVLLRVGYELHSDHPYVDRIMQIVNPSGNPEFDGPMSLIGGFVMTRWPDPHPLKATGGFLRPELRDVGDSVHGLTLAAGQWNDHRFAPTSADEVFAWMDQPFSMSVTNDYAAGRSATLSHIGPSDNADVGICFCAVHGSIEMGGGLIHGGISLPIGGGASTIEARRRLELPGTGTGAEVVHVYEAETDLAHGFGRADADGWSASTADDPAGTMIYGPYATDWGGLGAVAVFDLLVDNNTADDGVVVTLDIYDSTADRILAVRDVRRTEFAAPFVYQGVALGADLAGCAGRRMEARVYWHDISYVRIDKVTVTTID